MRVSRRKRIRIIASRRKARAGSRKPGDELGGKVKSRIGGRSLLCAATWLTGATAIGVVGHPSWALLLLLKADKLSDGG